MTNLSGAGSKRGCKQVFRVIGKDLIRLNTLLRCPRVRGATTSGLHRMRQERLPGGGLNGRSDLPGNRSMCNAGCNAANHPQVLGSTYRENCSNHIYSTSHINSE